jgi:hypothetical protein
MSIEEFINHLKSSTDTELKGLYKKPVKEKNSQMPKTQVFEKNIFHQADILYMPDDKGFKFILVVVDPYDNSVDAEPVKDILSKNNDVLDAFKKIYLRNYLDFPHILTLDKGAEFTQEKVKKYFKDKSVYIKYSLTGRSRQLATVERMNQRIGTVLLKRMANQELITGEVSKEWVDDLKPLIKYYNEHKKKPLKKEIYPDPIVDSFSGDLYVIGDKVRIQLDYPIDNVKGNRIYGKFRSGDTKWTQKVYKITEVLLKPGFPPMYFTDADDYVARTKNQLQKVGKTEKEPDARFIRGNHENYIISKILDKKNKDGRVFYLVKWKGFNENEATWIQSNVFDRTKDLQEMRKNFNNKLL